MSGASTFTKAERFAIALADARQEFDIVSTDCEYFAARAKGLEDENVKLRELVRDVWHLFTEHGAVNPCDLPVVDAVRDRMRELGIEAEVSE